MIPYQEPDITELVTPEGKDGHVRLFVLHEYKNNRFVSGNKWWKLRDNIQFALTTPHKTVLSFGGAHSNHIYALSAAAKQTGLHSIGIIRGEEVENETLAFARSQGMKLEFISRDEYRRKTEHSFLENLAARYGPHHLIPEGGTNELALRSCSMWGERLSLLDFDEVILPVGTGGTIAGIARGLSRGVVTGVSVLKNTGFLEDYISKEVGKDNWRILNDYHFGGYAKMPADLLQFCEDFTRRYFIPVEPVYTGKLFYAVSDGLRRGLFKQGSRVLVIHTGGLRQDNNEHA